MTIDEDPAPTPAEHEQAPEQTPEHQAAEGAGHDTDRLPGDDPPPEPIHES
jgi:hypothetical protein